MQNGKSPGPNGFTIEFYKTFYDFLRDDLLLVLRDSRNKGKVYGPFNSTFLCLISKKQNPKSFDDFRPISCCNVIYKLISKFISRRLRPLLSEITREEQLVLFTIDKFMMWLLLHKRFFSWSKKKPSKQPFLSWIYLKPATRSIGLSFCLALI